MGLIRYTKNRAIRKVAKARIAAVVVPVVVLATTLIAPEMADSNLTKQFGEAIAASIASAIVWYTAYKAKSSSDDVDPRNYEHD